MTDLSPANAPRFSASEAAALAEEHFGIQAEAMSLPSERDQNFLLQSGDSQAYVLKIANAAEAEAALDLQTKALQHLTNHGLAVPTPQSNQTGALVSTVTGPDGEPHFVRLLTYLPGTPLAEAKPHSLDVLAALGCYLGQMDRALSQFDHPAAQRDLHWDLRQAGPVIRRHLAAVTSPDRQALVSRLLQRFEAEAQPHLAALRQSVIHNDANDYNVLLSPADPAAVRSIAGLIDFGDMLRTCTIAEVAIACAYAMLGKRDPLGAATAVIAAYHREYPLEEAELAVLFPLITMRLCMSVTLAAHQRQLAPDNAYLGVSEAPAWALLEQLAALSPNLAHYVFRQACGLPPCPQTAAVVDWLAAHQSEFSSVIETDPRSASRLVFDLSIESPDLPGFPHPDTEALSNHLFGQLSAADAKVGLGLYNEVRPIYHAAQFYEARETHTVARNVHLGLDFFVDVGTLVFAPLDGVVHSFHNNAATGDYGPTIILEHTPPGGPTFYTLYGHLSPASLQGLMLGQPVRQGQQLGHVGTAPHNGNWPPHLHFQLITDMLDYHGDFPGTAPADRREVWLSLSPDPNLIVGLPDDCFPSPPPTTDAILTRRQKTIGPSLSISYRHHLHIVRGQGPYLYAADGRPYLDGVNNVCHVGHSHPQVVAAARRQMQVLNTNTRYLHRHLVEYAERLIATLPEPLSVCYFVCTGSEANELALRLAQTYTGAQDMLVLDAAYHGHTSSLIDLSPYKFNGPGGRGAPPWVQVLPMPDGYRGQYKHSDPAAGAKYAAHVKEAIAEVQNQGRQVAGFIAESLLGCGGQVVPVPGYLDAAYAHVRAAGGVCIADEVQVGFGRVGSHFWGFELQDVVPDIVTMGKPIGNGHPLAAVVTTPEIAAAFNNGMEYFNTFGGNPVSCAVGLAVLDVIESEGLSQNAQRVGTQLKAALRDLQTRHPLIGEVRGEGLFLGLELVRNRETLAPAAAEAGYIVERLKDHGILLSTDGPLHNVLKFKPPLVFSESNAAFLVETLSRVLNEDAVAPQRFA